MPQALHDPLFRLGEVQRATWIRVTPQCAVEWDQPIADQGHGPAEVPGDRQASHARGESNGGRLVIVVRMFQGFTSWRRPSEMTRTEVFVAE